MNASDRRDDAALAPAAQFAGGADRYQALLDIMEDQARRKTEEQRRRTSPPADRGPRRQRAALLILVAVSAWLWLLPPSWLTIGPPPPPPLAEEEASLRFVMYLQAQRIRTYEIRHGRLPEALEEAGPRLPGMTYAIIEEGVYELTGTTDRVRLAYRSYDPLASFVGAGGELMEEVEVEVDVQ